MFQHFALTEQGASHIKTGKPCEDASGSFSLEYTTNKGKSGQATVVIVADGHGGDKYFRSKDGSKFAVDAARESIENFINATAKNGKAFFNPDEEIKRSTMPSNMEKLERNIVSLWRTKVLKDIGSHPWTEDEKKFCDEKNITIPRQDDKVRLRNVYGSTLIAALVATDFWFILQIGDGAALIILPDLRAYNPIPEDEEQGFGITKSLCNIDADKQFRHNFGFDSILGVEVFTDGIEDSFSREKLIDFAVFNIFQNCIKAREEAEEELKKFLPVLSKNGSADDVSIAVAFNIYDPQSILSLLEQCNKENHAKIEETDSREKEGKEEEKLEKDFEKEPVKKQSAPPPVASQPTSAPKTAPNPKSSPAHIKSGDSCYKGNEYTEVTQPDPNTAASYLVCGQAYYNNREYDKAIEYSTKAIQLNPNDATAADAYQMRGQVYYDNRKYDKAIEDFTQAIQLNPKDADAYQMRGQVYYDNRKYDKAIRDFAQAIQLNPKDADAYQMRGQVYYDKKEYDKAIRDFTQAIQLNPNDDAAYQWRGQVYYFKKEYDKAIRDFTQAIQLNPNDDAAYQMRGQVYYCKKEYNKAIEDSTQAIELNPKDAAAYALRGLVYYCKKEYNKAKEDSTQAMNLNPRNKLAEAILKKINKKIKGQ